jgi:coproporphyrinogen III oxidase
MPSADASRLPAASPAASEALDLVSSLQERFVHRLEQLADGRAQPQPFHAVEWLRDGGRHGGGIRYETGDGSLIWRGSVNVSQVHYDDDPARKLGSANAISTIIHPRHPLAPSVHIHVSFTERKDGPAYWRVMADLNPSHAIAADTSCFLQALQAAAPAVFDEAKAQGESYFWIPALERHRGVAHFYLENYRTDDPVADLALARGVGEAAIDSYATLLATRTDDAQPPSEAQRNEQLAYHTLYFFQVLTLDRGTTSGLLVHDQNDVGIMGSLPPFVDRGLLSSWLPRLHSPQTALLQALIDCLPEQHPAPVEADTKQRLATAVRHHYRQHPEALNMQAAGYTTPPTVDNHR